ncbi:hypothetical protein ACN2XU_04450 [Primorskyibacter sp. 2E107]|uniref:hypothetical protein n=1 Tax=Primorskyibacter sp. 2E107 TaxID=3403458 RepID=UPI003AF43049
MFEHCFCAKNPRPYQPRAKWGTRTVQPYYPGHDFTKYSARGVCGKKNCAAKMHLLGTEPITVNFGGSGDPGDDFQPGDVVKWKYNNMVAHNPRTGPIIGRLARDKPSTAKLDIADVNGAEVLTVTEVTLYLEFEIRRLGITIPPTDPIRLRLKSIPGPDHFEFEQLAPSRIINMLSGKMLGFRANTVSVTGQRGLTLDDGRFSDGQKSIGVIEQDAIKSVTGPMIWIAHVPDDPDVPLQTGFYTPGEGVISLISDNFPSAATVQVEVLSLRDPSHYWSILQTGMS